MDYVIEEIVDKDYQFQVRMLPSDYDKDLFERVICKSSDKSCLKSIVKSFKLMEKEFKYLTTGNYDVAEIRLENIYSYLNILYLQLKEENKIKIDVYTE